MFHRDNRRWDPPQRRVIAEDGHHRAEKSDQDWPISSFRYRR